MSWSRRLEEAREERARVLAARERGDPAVPPPGATGAAASAGGPPEADGAEVPPEDELPSERPGARRRHLSWRIAGGFLAGAAAGAAVVWLLLPGAQTDPLVAEGIDASAPGVAIAPPPAPSQPPPAAPAPSRGAVEEEVVAEEVAEVLDLPAVTAADRVRASRREAVTPDEDRAAADPLPDAAGSATPATPSPDELAGISSASMTDSPAEAAAPSEDGGAAPARPDGDAGPSAVAGAGEEQEPASTAFGGGADGEVGGVAAATDTTPSTAAGNVADAAPDASDLPDVEAPAEEVAPPPAEPQPLEVVEEPEPDAGGTAPQETPLGGVGLIYVHAAPGVTSDELEAVVARLSGAGFAVEEARRVGFRISQTNVRYFHEEDAELSAGVAQAVSGISRDFTDYEPSPDPGTIEVWLEG